ncbi:hypothetical protein Ahy_B03g067974 isoform D [Arachis hypogaea]|uniref:CDP-diacylglycerol--inositol 3-phosphatidyltransferase n=1 Tax=Arachis hypogaea TaxID=3818 RepID=A0A445A8D3_ARAHY|nr:hypothetical protein Ahy_B03g067974 isoform D [Arachis hypogaea]
MLSIFVCDAVDGWAARKFNQVSTFGAVLDMVTDRISTACLLVVLSQVYKPGLIFLSLLALDIASHWLQMYSFCSYPLYSAGSLLNPFLSFGESYRDIDGRFSNKSAKDINSLFSNCNKFCWMHNQAAYKCDSVCSRTEVISSIDNQSYCNLDAAYI